MTQIDQAKALDLMKRMKDDVRETINKYATESSELSVNSTDPHSPILGFMQMALANAGADYMNLCGATPIECLQVTVDITGQAMQQWVNAVLKAQNISLKVDDKDVNNN